MKFPTLIALLSPAIILAGCATTNPPTDPTPIGPNPPSLRLISQTPTLGWTYATAVQGDTAFVADGEQGISIWRVANLSSPVCVDTITEQLSAEIVDVRYAPQSRVISGRTKGAAGGWIFYNRNTGRKIGNIGALTSTDLRLQERQNGDSLIVVSGTTSEGRACWAEVRTRGDGFVSAATSNFGFEEPLMKFVYGLGINGNHIYFAHGEHGLSIINFTINMDGIDGTAVGNVDTRGSARELVFNRAKTHVIVADDNFGIAVIDVTNPAAPRVVSTLLPPKVNEVLHIASIGDTVVFTDRFNGVYAADVSTPTNPSLFGRYDTSNPTGIFIRESDATIFLSDLDLGLVILKF